MLPWIHLASAVVPDDGGTLRLMQRGHEFSIMAGATELMNSRLSGSEESLATLTWAAIVGDKARVDGARVLIGGMGMGFTLRAQLAVSDPRTRITVAELVPEVLDWARGPMAALHGDSLTDPRVSFHLGDIGPLIRERAAADPAGTWDAILLDVDNGPEGLTRKANDRIYGAAGLAAARQALRPGGVLAVWSSAPHAAFSRRLQQAGFAVTERSVRARVGKGGSRHVIWLASRPS
ncbi:MAG: spermidine synthase [Caulobacter sp.]|nr:spermidine synthase [Caulobacter sp.]